MELLDLIHAKVVDGFDGVNTRLDTLNGQVRKHGEDIAVLKRETARIEVLDVEIRKAVLQQNLCAFNCPWKQEMMEAGGNPAVVATNTKRTARIQMAKAGVVASGLTALFMEILPNVLDWIGVVSK